MTIALTFENFWQDAIDDMVERHVVAMDPCIGARETAQALSVLIALLTTRAESAKYDDLEGQRRLEAVRAAFYKLESKQLNDEDRRKMFNILLGTATEKNSSTTLVEEMSEAKFAEEMARIRKEQKGVMDERALILTILKLLSQKEFSEAEEKLGKLSELKPMTGMLPLLAGSM